MATKDKRTGWLLNLKVGDMVFVKTYGLRSGVKLTEVIKITPGGRITVFNRDGYNRNFDYTGTEIGVSLSVGGDLKEATTG